MAQYCVYCYNGIHKTYCRKSKDFVLTKDYRKCAGCGRQRHLVVVRLFPHIDHSSPFYYCFNLRECVEFYGVLFFYLPLNVTVWT